MLSVDAMIRGCKPEPLRLTAELPPDFEEIAPLAGWVHYRQKGPYVGPADPGPLGIFTPSHRSHFHCFPDEQSAHEVLPILRKRLQTIPLRGDLAILRFGLFDAGSLNKTDRITFELNFADFLRSPYMPTDVKAAIGHVRAIEAILAAEKTPEDDADSDVEDQSPDSVSAATDLNDNIQRSRASVDRPPLSDEARAVLAILRNLPESEGRTGLELVQALRKQTPSITVDVDRIKGSVRRELRPYGIDNKRGAGYFIPMSKRAPN
jgi:hypothetical protein